MNKTRFRIRGQARYGMQKEEDASRLGEKYFTISPDSILVSPYESSL